MTNIQSDVTEIKVTLESVVDNQKILFDSVNKTNRLLEGDREHYIEGMIDKVERHEKTVQTVNTILANAKFFWAMMSVLGISSVASLIDLVQKVFAK